VGLCARETDEANLSRLASFFHRFLRAVFAENAVRVFHAEHFVMLHEVDHVCSQPQQTLIDLLRGGGFRATVDLRHQEHFLTVAIGERFAHPQFAAAVVVVSAVVHEVDARVDDGADDFDALGFVCGDANVETAEANARHFLTGLPELTESHVAANNFVCGIEAKQRHFAGLRRFRGSAEPAGEQWCGSGGSGGVNEFAALHG
jgi:hypothetical protein